MVWEVTFRGAPGRATIGWLVVFVIGILIGTMFVRKSAEIEPKPQPASPPEFSIGQMVEPIEPGSEDIVAEDIELVQGAEGRIDWKIRARVARYSRERNLVSLIKPELFAYIGENRDEVFVRAETGQVDQEADNFRLRENVVGRYGFFALKADELDYIGAMDKIYLKGKVIIYRPDVDVRATAIEIDVLSREMIAAGGVTAVLRPQDVDNKHLERLGLAPAGKE